MKSIDPRQANPKKYFAENPKDKVILAVDLDECCFDYLGGFRTWLKEKHGLTVPEGSPPSWNLKVSGWFEKEDDFHRYHEEAVTDGIYRTLPLLPGTRATLWDLVRSGYEINIITSRFVVNQQHLQVVSQTAEAIETNKLPYSNIMFQKNKFRFIADAYVDDGPHNLSSLLEHGRFVVKMNQNYNSHIVSPNADTWEEAREILRERFGR